MSDDDYEYRDGLVDGPSRGRGAGLNPGNRFEDIRLHVAGEYLDHVEATRDEAGDGHTFKTACQTTVLPDNTRTLINRVNRANSPDIPFDWTINPYRGCEHGCIYCYARPGHEYLGMSLGLDFETKIMAKHDAPALLRRELAKPSWQGEPIMMAGVTDCYQPIERELKITRGCLEVMAQCRQPVAMVTKNRLILRDLDVLAELTAHNAVRVGVSLTTLDKDLARKMEPRASSPADRLGTMRRLSEAGVPVLAMVAPVIPGLNDREIPAILQAAADAGAYNAAHVLLRLPYQIKDLFLDWLRRHFPDRAGHVESLIRQTRGGDLYDARTHVRMKGVGPIADQIADLMKLFRAKYGLDKRLPAMDGAAFRKPGKGGQMALF